MRITIDKKIPDGYPGKAAAPVGHAIAQVLAVIAGCSGDHQVSGLSKPDAWRLGALMNTRGLMELIVLSIGLQLGLISQSLYAIVVIVAIATTMMKGPLLGMLDRY